MSVKIYNTSEEIGVRILFIVQICQKRMSSQRIMYYDYFALHLCDIDRSYESLHPDNPNHSSEIAIRRKFINEGINLMISKGLLSIKYTQTGIYYVHNNITDKFLEMFDNEYVEKLKRCIFIVNEKFSSYSDKQIYKYIDKNIGSWVGEFERNSYVGGRGK